MYTNFISQLNRAVIRPLIEPTKANKITSKVAKQYILRIIDLLVQGPMFFCTKYISTGKYTTTGQKLIAPATPTTWLK